MKRMTVFLAFLMIGMMFITLLSKEEKDKKIYHLSSLYVFDETMTLISETDYLCSYFISRRIKENIHVIGAEKMDTGQIAYSDGDKLFINVGSKHGFKEGDRFLLIAKGGKIPNPLGGGNIGTYYLKKGLGKITCIYDDKAIITLDKACGPIELSDIALPYKKEDVIKKRKIDYQKCRLPRSAVKGNVVYTNVFIDISRRASGPGDYVTINRGKAYVSKGDYVLFYKFLKSNLPPVIIGSGIVLNPQHNNATVKILDTSEPIAVGTRILLMPEEKERLVRKEEKVPIIETPEIGEEELGEETLEANILFDIGEKTIDEQKYQQEFDRIAGFIAPKSRFIIILRGYTCSIGGFEYNLKLSQERVEFIKELLLKKLDIDEKFIETYFYGEKDIPFDNTTEEQRRKNRLVNIQVTGK